jgi:RAT1-interacting protein
MNESIKTLSIRPFSLFNTDLDLFLEPKEIGNFVSEKRKEKSNSVKYLCLPKDCSNLNYDLRKEQGQKFKYEIPHKDYYETFLKWIITNKEKLTDNNADKNLSQKSNEKLFWADFICWRGLFTTLLLTPYTKNWSISINLFKGTYYLSEVYENFEFFNDTASSIHDIFKAFSYWGFKFETYVTSDLPDTSHEQVLASALNTTPDPDDNYSTVVQAQVGNHKLVYTAEIDCCLEKQHTSLNDYCELKTQKYYDALEFGKNLKFFKWFIQTHVVGIETLHVGLRNDLGFLQQIVKIKKMIY